MSHSLAKRFSQTLSKKETGNSVFPTRIDESRFPTRMRFYWEHSMTIDALRAYHLLLVRDLVWDTIPLIGNELGGIRTAAAHYFKLGLREMKEETGRALVLDGYEEFIAEQTRDETRTQLLALGNNLLHEAMELAKRDHIASLIAIDELFWFTRTSMQYLGRRRRGVARIVRTELTELALEMKELHALGSIVLTSEMEAAQQRTRPRVELPQRLATLTFRAFGK